MPHGVKRQLTAVSRILFFGVVLDPWSSSPALPSSSPCKDDFHECDLASSFVVKSVKFSQTRVVK